MFVLLRTELWETGEYDFLGARKVKFIIDMCVCI
jgi:hypothetical protein